MQPRILDFAEEPAGLNVSLDQLVIRSGDNKQTVPLEEIGIVIISNPAVALTHAVLSGICERGGAIIVCNEKRLPAGMMLPFEGNFVQSERFESQASASLPVKKYLWRQIVRAKVQAQGVALKAIHGREFGFVKLALRVRTGDAQNIEAIASAKYWPLLFGADFRRHRDRGDQNLLLNYGYAVLRAMTARAICAAGLHPSLGLHHHNKYNPFCLADDLMEPYRPLVDLAVSRIITKYGSDIELDRQVKAMLISAITSRSFQVDGECRSLFDILNKVAASLVKAYLSKRPKLYLPVLVDAETKETKE